MEAESMSKTLVNIYQNTWCYISEDSQLHIPHHKNLKSHLIQKLRNEQVAVATSN
jgi:hypothetical protein